jgi:hypothetical protein
MPEGLMTVVAGDGGATAWGAPDEAWVHVGGDGAITAFTGCRPRTGQRDRRQVFPGPAHEGLARTHAGDANREQSCHHWQQALDLYTEIGAPEAREVRADLAGQENTSDHGP